MSNVSKWLATCNTRHSVPFLHTTGLLNCDDLNQCDSMADQSAMLSVSFASDLLLQSVRVHEIGPVMQTIGLVFLNASESLMHQTLAKF